MIGGCVYFANLYRTTRCSDEGTCIYYLRAAFGYTPLSLVLKPFLNPLTADIWVGFASQPAPLQTTCSSVKIWQLIVPDIPRKTGYFLGGGLRFRILSKKTRRGPTPHSKMWGFFFKTVLFCPVLGLEPLSQTGTPQTRPPPLFFFFFFFFLFMFGKENPPPPSPPFFLPLEEDGLV